MQELVQQILRLAPFGLGASFLGAPLPADISPQMANGTLVNGKVNGHHPVNGTAQVRHQWNRQMLVSGSGCMP